jgi:hypothetical protein
MGVALIPNGVWDGISHSEEPRARFRKGPNEDGLDG